MFEALAHWRRALFHKEHLEQELDKELRFHLEMQTKENIESGMTPDEARYAALRRFGGVEQIKEECRDAWGVQMIDSLWQDLRYAVRTLAKSPGFTVVAVLSLALGIGANTAIFSLVNTVLLDPLPYREPDRLVKLWSARPFGNQVGVEYPNFADWRARNRVFAEMAAFDSRFLGDLNLTGTGEPVQLHAVAVTAAFFDLLGVPPAHGRTFSSDADEPATSRRVMLSHGVWQRRFGADPDLVGEAIVLDGEPYTVVGIMPRDFWFEPQSGLFERTAAGNPADIWVPLASTPTYLDFRERRQAHWLRAIARLAPGVTLEQAREEMRLIARRLEEEYPRWNRELRVSVVPWHEELVGHYRVTLLTLLGAVGFVLLIACANVANLLMARSTARQRETVIRAALGAGRLRLVRQFLTESVLLATFGGALGLLLAWGGIRIVVAISPPEIPRLGHAGIDAWVLGFTFGLSLLTGLIFGLAPALHGSAPRLSESLKAGSRTLVGLAPKRFRNVMAVAEIALAVVLLTGAGLMIRSFLALRAIDAGFDERGVLTAQIRVPSWKYPEDAQVARFFQQVLERVEALPGVDPAGIVSNLPRGGVSGGGIRFEGRPRPPPGQKAWVQYLHVSPDYFRALGIPVLRGRQFTERDSGQSPAVAIISESAASKYWPNQDPVGQRIHAWPDWNRSIEIVGIVADVVDPLRPGGAGPVTPALYLPHLQVQAPDRSMFLAVHTTSDPLSLVGPVRDEVWQVDPDQPVSVIMTMEQLVEESISRPQFYMRLLSMFGVVALLLVGIGVYGVLNYSVTQRTFEIGVRMALGAERGDVIRLVLKQGLVITVIGIAIGAAAALGVTRFISSFLYGVTPTDPTTFVAVSAVLLVVGLLACYIPARRATKIDPMVALRYE